MYSPHRLLHGLSFLVSSNLVLLNIAKIFIPPFPFTVSFHVTLLSTLPTFNFTFILISNLLYCINDSRSAVLGQIPCLATQKTFLLRPNMVNLHWLFCSNFWKIVNQLFLNEIFSLDFVQQTQPAQQLEMF